MSQKVSVSIRFTNGEDRPVAGLRVDLHGAGGFIGERETDRHGSVRFSSVNAWETYDLWVQRHNFDSIGVGGGDEDFSFSCED